MIILHPRSLDRHWMNECDEWKCLVLLDAHTYVRETNYTTKPTRGFVRRSVVAPSSFLSIRSLSITHHSFFTHSIPCPCPSSFFQTFTSPRSKGRDRPGDRARPYIHFHRLQPRKELDNCTVYPYTIHREYRKYGRTTNQNHKSFDTKWNVSSSARALFERWRLRAHACTHACMHVDVSVRRVE